jgi:hypothetical protein
LRRPNQKKTLDHERRGRTTKPFLSSLGLTISMRSRGTLVPPLQLAIACSRDRPKIIFIPTVIGSLLPITQRLIFWLLLQRHRVGGPN